MATDSKFFIKVVFTTTLSSMEYCSANLWFQYGAGEIGSAGKNMAALPEDRFPAPTW